VLKASRTLGIESSRFGASFTRARVLCSLALRKCANQTSRFEIFQNPFRESRNDFGTLGRGFATSRKGFQTLGKDFVISRNRFPISGNGFPRFSKSFPDVSECFPKIVKTFPDTTEAFRNVSKRPLKAVTTFREVAKRFPSICRPLPDVLRRQLGRSSRDSLGGYALSIQQESHTPRLRPPQRGGLSRRLPLQQKYFDGQGTPGPVIAQRSSSRT
jgi:hypothetical protein